MSVISVPETEHEQSHMKPSSMIGTEMHSFAKECAKSCRAPDRIEGVKGHKKHAKREWNAAINKRFYHVQESSGIDFIGKEFKMKGFSEGLGAVQCCHMRADCDLGLGKIALR